MKLLLHMCCGPCSTYPVQQLQNDNIEIEGFFYNPNIHPIDEHQRRMENVRIFAQQKNIKVHYSDTFMQDKWEAMKDIGEKRCTTCYSLRLDETAKLAAQMGFDAFSTTLLVSPYQKHDLIKELGETYALKYGIKFLYNDYRSGFREGQKMARDMGLYRQKYCGCILSLNDK